MNVADAHRAIILLNASYGNRAAELDEAQMILWAHTLAEISPQQWSSFEATFKRTEQGQQWPPAVVDFQGWFAGETRRLNAIRRSAQQRLPADSSPSRVDGAAMIRQIRAGLPSSHVQ